MAAKRTLTIIALSCAALVAVKYLFLKNPSEQNASDKSNKQTITVKGIFIQPVLLNEQITCTGTVMANEEALLRAEMPGRITDIFFNEGAAVQKGDLLVKLNDSDLQAQLSKLEAGLQLQRDIVSRKKRLLEMNGVSQQEYDEALNQIIATESDIRYVQAQIAKTQIRAPFNGTIGLRTISIGSTVNTSDIVAAIQQLDPVKIDFNIPEKYIAHAVKIGGSISFTADGINDTLNAKIYACEPKVDPNTRTLRMRAITANDQRRLLPGSFVRVKLAVSANPRAILVPTDCVIPVLKGKKVFVFRNGMAQSQPIITGIRSSTMLEVTEGLNQGDTVITSGIMQLRDSMMVQVQLP